jgi:hypothetical protein
VRDGRLVEVRDTAEELANAPGQLERVARGQALGRAVVDLRTG